MTESNKEVKILVVDDDQIDVIAIKRALSKSKISNPLLFAKDGVEALGILRGTDTSPALTKPYLVLLDLNMPRMDGLQFLKELHSDPNLSDTIIFVLTTSERDEDRVAAYQQFIAGYLLKQNAGECLLRVIQMLESFVLSVQFPVD